jgi:hypothetical protein
VPGFAPGCRGPTTICICFKLRTLADPTDERHQELLDWVGGAFSPDAFSVADVRFDDPENRWRIALGGEDPEPGMRINYQPVS